MMIVAKKYVKKDYHCCDIRSNSLLLNSFSISDIDHRQKSILVMPNLFYSVIFISISDCYTLIWQVMENFRYVHQSDQLENVKDGAQLTAWLVLCYYYALMYRFSCVVISPFITYRFNIKFCNRRIVNAPTSTSPNPESNLNPRPGPTEKPEN